MCEQSRGAINCMQSKWNENEILSPFIQLKDLWDGELRLSLHTCWQKAYLMTWNTFPLRSWSQIGAIQEVLYHDDVIKWKHFPRYWPFVRGIHRSPVNSPHKGQWRGALMFSLICVWITGWVNNLEAGDLIRYRAHYDVTVMHKCKRSKN